MLNHIIQNFNFTENICHDIDAEMSHDYALNNSAEPSMSNVA